MMGDVIDGMMGYVPLRVIMDKILAEHGNHPFGDFRATILNMLSAYGYERAILVCLAPLTSCIHFRYLIHYFVTQDQVLVIDYPNICEMCREQQNS